MSNGDHVLMLQVLSIVQTFLMSCTANIVLNIISIAELAKCAFQKTKCVMVS